MRVFSCNHCGHTLFFENVRCLNCGSQLAFLPDRLALCAIEPVPEPVPAQEPAATAEADAPSAEAPPADVPIADAPIADLPAADLPEAAPTDPNDAAASAPSPVDATSQASDPPAAPVPAPAGPAEPGAPRLWRAIGDEGGPTWRLCQNQIAHDACNFAVDASDPQLMCVSCRQTRLAPDLSVPGNIDRWIQIETAKRRLYYAMARLDLMREHGASLVFEFLADLPGGPPVMTGHQNGVITLNIAEADDDERARRRVALREPYRTLLGHLRHESGHYFWDRLILQQGRVEHFRELFGDETQDYAAALANYYAQGPSADWQAGFVSAYATAHPWEDWAETWAHYLHMVDLLETAAAYSTSLTVPGGSQARTDVTDPFASAPSDFDALVSQWTPVTLLLNSLNRALGQADAYPFALTPGALQKLRFVHDVIGAQATGAGTAGSPAP